MALLLNKKYKNKDYSGEGVSQTPGRPVEGGLTCSDIKFLTRLGYKVLLNCNEKHKQQQQQEVQGQYCENNGIIKK